MSDRRLAPCDWVVVAYSVSIAVLVAVRRAGVPKWWIFSAAHLAIACACIALARAPRNRVLGALRDFDLLAYIPALFLMACVLVHRVHPVDYDDRLIAIDRRIGGIALLKWMETIQSKFLTTSAKLLWVAYYFLPLLPGIPLYLRNRPAFHQAKLFYALSFLVSYVGYFALPAQGPGYFQQEIGVAQPQFEQSQVTSTLKETIYTLEGDARDTFPSGHVMVAAVSIVILLRNRLWRAAALGVPLGLGVIWSTLYLRYHYLIDGLVGLALVAGIVWIGARWQRRPAGRSG